MLSGFLLFNSLTHQLTFRVRYYFPDMLLLPSLLDNSVEFTDALHWKQEHHPAGPGLPNPAAGLVRLWVRAMVGTLPFALLLQGCSVLDPSVQGASAGRPAPRACAPRQSCSPEQSVQCFAVLQDDVGSRRCGRHVQHHFPRCQCPGLTNC